MLFRSGSGETCACGTGACACVVAGVLNGILERHTSVQMKGGMLKVEWDPVVNRVTLNGPAVTVFEGDTVDIESPYDFRSSHVKSKFQLS